MWLTQIRKTHGISQQQVADVVGISRAGYANIEIEKRRPSPEVAQKIGTMLGFDWTRFFDNDPLDETKAV